MNDNLYNILDMFADYVRSYATSPDYHEMRDKVLREIIQTLKDMEH